MLTGKNYSTWKFRMKYWLISQELRGLIDGLTAEPASELDKAVKAAYVRKSTQAMSIVVLSVSNDLLYLITSCVSSRVLNIELLHRLRILRVTNYFI